MSWKDLKEPEMLPEIEEECESLESFEQGMKEDLGELEASFRQRVSTENKRFKDTCDSGYYFCVCFQNAKQKEELLRKLGLREDGMFFEGKDFSRAVRKSIDSPDIDFAKPKAFDKDFIRMAMDK